MREELSQKHIQAFVDSMRTLGYADGEIVTVLKGYLHEVVIAVLKTTSPTAMPETPIDRPLKTAPSASTNAASGRASLIR